MEREWRKYKTLKTQMLATMTEKDLDLPVVQEFLDLCDSLFTLLRELDRLCEDSDSEVYYTENQRRMEREQRALTEQIERYQVPEAEWTALF